MKKFLLTVVCLICFMPAIGFATCEPVNCNTSTGNDRLNADTLENTREARRTAASCYICEDNYCEDGDIVYMADMSKFMVCRQSRGWLGDDKWQNYTPEYCKDRPDYKTAFNKGDSGLTKYWLIDGVSYSDTTETKNAATVTKAGQNICFYYDCMEGYSFNAAEERCLPNQSEKTDEKEEEKTDIKLSCVQQRCGSLTGSQKSECVTCCYVPASLAKWENGVCKCQQNPDQKFNPATLKCEDDATVAPQPVASRYNCDAEKIEQVNEWKTEYSYNKEISELIDIIIEYCKNTPTEEVFENYYKGLEALIKEVRSSSKSKISTAVEKLDEISEKFEDSVWKTAEGKFNTSRLISDSFAGVVLGTAGGLITSKVVKKNQVENGFEDIECSIGGQKVADWGDQFRVGIQ